MIGGGELVNRGYMTSNNRRCDLWVGWEDIGDYLVYFSIYVDWVIGFKWGLDLGFILVYFIVFLNGRLKKKIYNCCLFILDNLYLFFCMWKFIFFLICFMNCRKRVFSYWGL